MKSSVVYESRRLRARSQTFNRVALTRTCGKLRLIRETTTTTISQLYCVTLAHHSLVVQTYEIPYRYSRRFRLDHSFPFSILLSRNFFRSRICSEESRTTHAFSTRNPIRSSRIYHSTNPLSNQDRNISAGFICNSMLLPIIFRLNRVKYHLASRIYHPSSVYPMTGPHNQPPTPFHPSLPIPRLSLPWRSGTTINNQHPREQRGGAGERERRRRRKG